MDSIIDTPVNITLFRKSLPSCAARAVSLSFIIHFRGRRLIFFSKRCVIPGIPGLLDDTGVSLSLGFFTSDVTLEFDPFEKLHQEVMDIKPII